MPLNAAYASLECSDLLLVPNNYYSVVPVMNGHPRDQAKVSVHCRWLLVTGTDGQAGTPNIIHLAILPTTITISDIPNEYMHCHNYLCYSSKPKINGT